MSSRRSLGVAKMAGVALAAFGFAFALVPLYRIACEKVFGVRLEQGPQAAVEHEAKQERWVTVQFDGGVNSKLPWQFAPEQQSMRVQVGRQYEALYFARNTSDRGIVGSAVPSVAPARASVVPRSRANPDRGTPGRRIRAAGGRRRRAPRGAPSASRPSACG